MRESSRQSSGHHVAASGRAPVPTRSSVGGDVCAAVVSHNPTASLPGTVRALVAQVGEVVVVDNGSGPESRRWLEEVRRIPRVRVIQHTANLGIAAALNAAARYALLHDWPWLATFDQDSTVPPGYIAGLLAAYDACEYKDGVAVVAPVYREQRTGIVTSFARGNAKGAPISCIDATLTSGTLVRTRALEELGLYDESFFIDYVDVEFCLRCRDRGYSIIEVRDVELLHNLGHSRLHKVFGRKITATHHPVPRRYYNARNRTAVYRRYLRTQPWWVARDLVGWTKELIKVVCFEQDVLGKMRATLRGTWDGLIGRSGPRDL